MRREQGELHLRINELLEERGISKTRICKDMDIPRTNFNKYCRDEFMRLDVGLLCKLCYYLEKNKITVYRFAKKSGIPQSTIRSIVQKEDYEVRERNILVYKDMWMRY